MFDGRAVASQAAGVGLGHKRPNTGIDWCRQSAILRLWDNPHRLTQSERVDRVERITEVLLVAAALDVAQVRRGGDIRQREQRMVRRGECVRLG